MMEPPTNPRKERTEAELTKLGIPVNIWLPIVEPEEEATIRDPDDVAKRAVILYWLVDAAHNGNKKDIIGFLKGEGLWDYTSAEEIGFFTDDDPPQRAVIDATWRVEALVVLLWALGMIERLELPTTICNPNEIHPLMPKAGEVEGFVATASMRSASEILDEMDRIYRIHWAVREALIKHRAMPANLNRGVVGERHYALNWLTCYADDWDNITTDT